MWQLSIIPPELWVIPDNDNAKERVNLRLTTSLQWRAVGFCRLWRQGPGGQSLKSSVNWVRHLDLYIFKGLTLKIGNVKKLTPASRVGLCKMDYLISVGGLQVRHLLILPLSGQRQAGVQHDARRVLQGDKDVGSGSQTRVWEVCRKEYFKNIYDDW